MGRSPCCDESGLKKGPWTPEEDQKLVHFIQKHGHGSWRALPKLAGLNRCGKSCRLRWTNYLRPDIKRGKFSSEEEQTILNLHAILGNKWSAIATHLPGRTDNEIKNFWNTHLKKKLIQMGFDPMTHRPRTDIFSSLPHLIALANLKDLVENQPWEDQTMKLQSEVAKLQYLQYLLQPPTSNYPMPNLDMDTLNLLNSLPSFNNNNIKDQLNNNNININNQNNNPNLNNNQNPLLFDGIMHDHLPNLKNLDENTIELTKDDEHNHNLSNMISDHMLQPCEFTILTLGDENCSSPPTSPWLPSLSSSPSRPPLPPPPSATAATTTSIDGCGSFWPDTLLEDSLFQEIA
ncbi:hypothetical protein RND81_11G222300 [Saponaria officinalis]|uniref:Uncharacterized protein n=1 Tax=Saponaria officinalis TaxID=3572 RepID=A0AAW1HRI9_SAPOF